MRIKHPVLRGHPLHAMISDLPVTLIPVAAATAILERSSSSRETRFASRGAAILAASAAVAAMAVGWWDWLTIPREHEVRPSATTHGLLNSAVTAAAVAAVPLAARRGELLGGATVVLLIAAWIGGDLVYRLGWRVRPAEELELIAERPPADLDIHRRAAKARIADHEREDTLLPEAPSRR